MAYTKQVDAKVVNGLNTVSPWDALAPGEARQMQNLRLDEEGSLVSRRGYSTLYPTIVAHSLWFGVNIFWQGVGTSLLANNVSVATGFDGQKIWLAFYQGFAWAMNRGKQVVTNGATALPMTPVPPTTAAVAAAGAAGSLTGLFVYYYTFVDSFGHESNPGPASNELTVTNLWINVSGVAAGPAGTMARRIYRGGGTQGAILRVKELADNTTTSFTDTVRVVDALALDDELFIDNDPPPAAKGVVGPYFGKLIAWSPANKPARMLWTPTGRPAAWPGAQDNAAGNWVDVGADDDEIMCITNHNRYLVIYKQRSIWRLIGDPDTNDPELIDPNRGISTQDGAVNAGETDFFGGLEGLYKFNGDTIEHVAGKVDNIFEEQHDPAYDELNIAYGVKDSMVLGIFDDTIYVSFINRNNAHDCYKYHTEKGIWARETSALGGFLSFCYVARSGDRLMAGLRNGGVVYVEKLTTGDNISSPIPVLYQSGFLDQGAPGSTKRYGELALEYRTNVVGSGATTSTLTVEVLYDGGAAGAVTLGTISSATTKWVRFPLGPGGDAEGRKANNIALRISGNITSPIEIRKGALFFYGEAREARSFDSGVTDLGTNLDKSVQRFEVGFECASAVNFDVWTDLPGNTLASRETGSIAAAAGRRVATIILSPRDGRFMRFMGWSATPFQLHHLRIEKLDMAFYVDATRSYRTDFVTAAANGFDIAELREISLDYSSTAPIIATLFTDLPGGVLTARRTVTFPARATFGSEKLQFDDAANGFKTVDAKTFYVLFECPAGVGRVLSGSLGGRPFKGVYVDGATNPLGNYQSAAFAL